MPSEGGRAVSKQLLCRDTTSKLVQENMEAGMLPENRLDDRSSDCRESEVLADVIECKSPSSKLCDTFRITRLSGKIDGNDPHKKL
jgi:hypothetical protein